MDSSKKAAPMTKDEAMLLVQLVGANKIITNKATNATNNKIKDQAWQTVTTEFNSSVTTFPRSSAQLRLKWENLKKTARKRSANIKSSRNKTGGGKDYFPPDEVLDAVSSLLGNTCEGFTVEFGGDAASINFVDESLILSGDGQGDGDGVCGGSVCEGEVLKEIQILETPPPKQTNFFLNKASGSGTLAKQKRKLEEEKCKARIAKDNALTEYILAKKKKINLENEEKEVKLELEKLKLENLKKNLNKD